ncbi:MAG: DUF2950 family protein [Bacteroidota bacterium]
MNRKGEYAIRYLVSITIICALAAMSVTVAVAAQKTFPSPAAAVQALQAAVKVNDTAAIRTILGPEMDVLWCADPNEDIMQLQSFGQAMDKMCNVVFRTSDIAVLYVGAENYPFPIPLVQQNGCWRFDTAAGLEEIQCRRVGANELAAIETCRNYRLAQLEYAQKDCSGGGKCAYAQRFSGPPGGLTGLDFKAIVTPTSLAEPGVSAPCSASSTFTNRGYVFKILKGQGPAAAGGRLSYVVDGDMVGGFALAAYPQYYGESGVMSFLLGPDGRVYERCLGTNTPSWGASVTEFNPETGWQVVEE